MKKTQLTTIFISVMIVIFLTGFNIVISFKHQRDGDKVNLISNTVKEFENNGKAIKSIRVHDVEITFK